jgi:hypothetical protein
MKRIVLTQGLVAIVDDDDYERVASQKWYAGGSRSAIYARRDKMVGGKKIRIFMHRFIMNASDCAFVDHINGDGLDNRKANMRLCTPDENRRNIRKTRGTSKYKGVCFHKARGRWQSFIQIDKKTLFLGLFDDEMSAALAYDTAARSHHGEFACTNADLGLL